MLALVICSTSPQSIGGVMFQEHPTIRALIKMVTSGRFRFPTIDCDDETKKLMKREDHEARAKVCLFLTQPLYFLTSCI